MNAIPQLMTHASIKLGRVTIPHPEDASVILPHLVFKLIRHALENINDLHGLEGELVIKDNFVAISMGELHCAHSIEIDPADEVELDDPMIACVAYQMLVIASRAHKLMPDQRIREDDDPCAGCAHLWAAD